MEKLSVIITTYNEADHIAAVIENVNWVDEIIIVDSFSEDDTVLIAEKFPTKILQRKYSGPADQKNWAIPQASHQWVLILDADERVTVELKDEINKLLKEGIPKDAYWIPRENYFMGERIRYSGWQGDAVIRLINRDQCRYNHKQVHEEIETDNINVGKLKNRLKHFTFKNSAHFLDKQKRYALWSAQDYLDKTPKVTGFHLFIKPLFRFFKHYFLQKGFLDGRTGFIICVIMAWSVFLRYVHIIDIHRTERLEQK